MKAFDDDDEIEIKYFKKSTQIKCRHSGIREKEKMNKMEKFFGA